MVEKGIVFSAKMRYNVLKWEKRGEMHDLQCKDIGHHRHPRLCGDGGVLYFQWSAGF